MQFSYSCSRKRPKPQDYIMPPSRFSSKTKYTTRS